MVFRIWITSNKKETLTFLILGSLVTQGNCTCSCNQTTIGHSSNSSVRPTSVPSKKPIRLKIAAFYSLTTAPFLKELVRK